MTLTINNETVHISFNGPALYNRIKRVARLVRAYPYHELAVSYPFQVCTGRWVQEDVSFWVDWCPKFEDFRLTIIIGKGHHVLRAKTVADVCGEAIAMIPTIARTIYFNRLYDV